jgi:hypothetical protein
MDRVSGFDPEGCRFESYYSRCSQSCSSRVEHLPYKQGVTGSNPVRTTNYESVTQLDRVPVYETGCCRFKSCHSRFVGM